MLKSMCRSICAGRKSKDVEQVGMEGVDPELMSSTPQAFPHLQSSALSLMSTQLGSMISDHFVPSIPPLPILPPTK
jgi:exosome complex component RRP42